jgi:hypothetical protein
MFVGSGGDGDHPGGSGNGWVNVVSMPVRSVKRVPPAILIHVTVQTWVHDVTVSPITPTLPNMSLTQVSAR